jgi:UDP-N-acetylglucosamine:LPS N-acetylglucosamine transferase
VHRARWLSALILFEASSRAGLPMTSCKIAVGRHQAHRLHNAGAHHALQLVLIAGGAAGAKVLRTELRAAAKEQNRLAVDLDVRPGKRSARRPRVAVDATFLKRLGIILRM